jgi:hypothetical protein
VFSHAIDEFCKDAADCPEVDSWAIIFLEKNDFWCSVMTSNYMSSKFSFPQFPLIFGLNELILNFLAIFLFVGQIRFNLYIEKQLLILVSGRP